MKIEIELHEKWDFPIKKVYVNGLTDQFSVNVFAVDEDKDALSLCYNFHREQWEEVTGADLDEWIDFKWFYVPEALR